MTFVTTIYQTVEADLNYLGIRDILHRLDGRWFSELRGEVGAPFDQTTHEFDAKAAVGGQRLFARVHQFPGQFRMLNWSVSDEGRHWPRKARYGLGGLRYWLLAGNCHSSQAAHSMSPHNM